MTPEDRKKIIEAAQAIVDRWDSPAWKYGDPHTGVLIRDLERAIAPLRAEPETREPKVMSNEEIERIAEALCASMDAYTDWEDRHGYKQTGIRFLTYACDNNLFAPLDRSRMEDPVAMIRNDYDASVACSNCGQDGGFSIYDDLDWAKCCPGCGRPISEQVDAKGIRTPHPLYKK